MNDPLQRRVDELLAKHHVMTLATAGSSGPGAAAVFYAHEGARLYFLSSPNTRHSRHIALAPRVAITIQADCTEWLQVEGLQIEGQARRLSDTAAVRAREIYTAKFPFIGGLAWAPAALREAFAQVGWYEVVGERACVIDNSLGFGHRDEYRFS